MRDMAASHYVEARHSMFLAITLAGVATPISSYIIIGLDCAINLYRGSKIYYNIKIKNKSLEEGKWDICVSERTFSYSKPITPCSLAAIPLKLFSLYYLL